MTEQVREGLSKDGVKSTSSAWELEHAMRSMMIKKFINMSNESSPLKKFIMDNIDIALGIQNDADELPTGIVLKHLKYCEIKEDIDAIYLPCLSFKKNYHWLLTTSDMHCFTEMQSHKSPDEIKSHLWRPGPYVWPLKAMLKAGTTLRGEAEHYSKTKISERSWYEYIKSFAFEIPKKAVNPIWCHHHMGLGAATHMSSTAGMMLLYFIIN